VARNIYFRETQVILLISLAFSVILLNGCVRPDPEVTVIGQSAASFETPQGDDAEAANQARVLPPTPFIKGTRTPLPAYFGTPTPDPPKATIVEGNENYNIHFVGVGDTLGQIAVQYETTIEELQEINKLEDSDFLAIGQELLVPGGSIVTSPSFKIIPDSELVYGPRAKGFEIRSTVAEYGGYLLGYQEEIEGHLLDGPSIVQLVADRQSVNPRLLLALLEHRTGWVTHPTGEDNGFPLGYIRSGYEGLYQQLSWAANIISLGYYGRSEGGMRSFEFNNGEIIFFAPEINDGTAGIQLLFTFFPEIDYESWLGDVGEEGIHSTFNRLFGNPFAYTVDPVLPPDLTQPSLSLPWPIGETWYLTGGPHGGWASGSAWAAIDFAPPDDQLGCYESESWVTAMVDGLITRSELGGVTLDLDGDGYAGTGWAISYLHLATKDRVAEGSFVRAGDRLGHPSCEGGFSNGTHVHLARTYNGRWISADGAIPFVMSGWTSQGQGNEYDGLLIRGETVKEACECREEINSITAE
jgi:LysM repeat protein